MTTLLWIMACTACFIAGWCLPSPRSNKQPIGFTLLESSTRNQMESGCPWPTEWQYVSHGRINFAIGIEDRSMWSPSRHSLFVYAKQPNSDEWYIQLVVPDIIGGGPIRMQLDSESGLMEFLQVTGANKGGSLRELTIATYDTGSVAPFSE